MDALLFNSGAIMLAVSRPD